MPALFSAGNAENIRLTSPATSEYNCLAWALSVNDQSIWPDPDEYNSWPPDLPREETLQVVQEFLRRLGFEECQTPNFEGGFVKIAIYMSNLRVSHVARLCPEGYWESKCGLLVDVQHTTLQALSPDYGIAAVFMRRSSTSWPPELPQLHPGPALLISASTGGRLI